MSNFNYLRLVNLNYNNNNSKIDDQLFYLNGENTMLNLKNGGGKSVIVQMMIAPFVRNRYRDLNYRTFDSYFTGKMPTYIMMEWNLDDNAGYLLTGMMVRKKEVASDENSKETLDIINFIYEYKWRNKYDIKSIPIIEKDGEGRKIKSFGNSKKLFDEIKKDPEFDFNYYDMNNSGTSRAYFNKLREYGIDHKEWENIIKRINLTESGLSQLFKEAKNTEGLIKKWFLPNIEEKLSRDEDRIKNYRDILEKYIFQYKSNKSDIDRKSKIEIFTERSVAVKAAAVEFKENETKLKMHENKIANYIKALSDYIEEKENNLSRLDGELLKNKQELKEIKYEELSMNIYLVIDEIDKLEKEIDNKIKEIEEARESLNKLKKEHNILNCANVYERYKEYSKELQKIETKLKAIRYKQKDNAPRINDLGYTIKKYLKDEYNALNIEMGKNKDSLNLSSSQKADLQKNIEEFQKILNKISNEEGKLSTKIKAFDEVEDKFNRTYNENLLRNIEGYYLEEDLIVLGRDISLDIEKFEKEKRKIEEDTIEKDKLLNAKKSEKDKKGREESRLKVEFDNVLKDIKNYEEDIIKRKDIVKYINLDENKMFDREEIVNGFNKKIEMQNIDLQELYKDKHNIEGEIYRLNTGKIDNLPKDFIDELKNREINITYGMEYLKKNELSEEDNIELVKKNPFIPYSLIMNSREINILAKDEIEVFTSVPIPIISRENIECLIENRSGNIIEFDDIRFYTSFNNKLLNKEELKRLLELKEKEILKIDNYILEKKESIDFYNDKKGFINNSKLTKELYEKTNRDLKEKEEAIKINKEGLISLNNIIGELTDAINENDDKSDELKENIKESNRKLTEYNYLVSKYEQYQGDKEQFDMQLEKKRLYLSKIDECSTKLEKFKGYNNGNIINSDLEDLYSEYEVITKEISESMPELEEEFEKENEKFRKVEKELSDKISLYNIEENNFKDVIYDSNKESKLINDIEKIEEKIDGMKDNISEYGNRKAKEEANKSNLYDQIKELINRDKPKDRSEIFNKNFKEELANLNIKEQELNSKKVAISEELNLLKINKNGLNEYDFEIETSIEVEFNISKLDSITGKLKRDYRLINKSIGENEKKLVEIVDTIANDEMFNNDLLFVDAMDSLKKVCNNPNSLLKQLEIILDSYERLVEKLMHDIEIINKEEKNILTNLYEYISLVNKNVDEIDENSSININGKSIKMLKISVVNMEENKELYMMKLKEYIQNIRDYCVGLLEKNESISEYIQNSITIVKLYDEIISIGNINIKLYKIEENRQKQITWDEVSKNSGGEGFLSAFIILSSLLSYMRREDRDIFSRKESSKVLIMDNPFAQTNAEHLLKPLMDISKKSKTQLICLTGLGGDSIINRFDNIYVMNLVTSKLKNGLRVMLSDHIVGEEESEVMVSSRVKVEDVQLKLF
ncbi:hypothetical protein [Clostridium cibarium]|uniref:Chromosome partition protein Smc n=1 Tax=Clostridium cibarium TaxID=2762247 RepID=A0ABR8PWE9_9CLOT|nr:hypothetical protein [Clostridium cibarium]MBD7912483.1 hypothetical protein [Clostridium cibarium]